MANIILIRAFIDIIWRKQRQNEAMNLSMNARPSIVMRSGFGIASDCRIGIVVVRDLIVARDW